MASNTVVAVRLVVMLAAIHNCIASNERVHFRIVVPEFINTMTHTKTVYVVPKKGKSFEDLGLASALGAAGGGTGLGGTYGGAMGTGYGSAASYGGTGPTSAGYGATGQEGSGSGGYSYSSGQGGARPSVVDVTGGTLTSYGHSSAQHVSPGPSPTPPSLPVIIPLRAPPLPPPPPPGTIIVAAGHDASLAELLSHSNRVRNAIRAQRLLRYNRLQPTGGVTATATPVTQVTQSVHSPRLQSQQGSPTVPPALQPVYGYYGLNNGQRYQPITVYQSSSVSQASKGSKCHGGNLVGVSGSMAVQDGQSVRNGHGQHYHTVYTTPQTTGHGNAAYVDSQSHGHGYFGNGGSYGVYTGFTTPQTVSVNQGHALYNAYSALPVPPAYSALQGNQNVRPTMSPIVTTSGQINNAGYTTTQVYPTVQYHSNTGGNYVYHGSPYRQPQYTSYGNKLPDPYGTQKFSIKDGRHNFPGSPQHYQNLPQSPPVPIKPKDKHKNDKKPAVVKCRKDERNGLVCIASANVQKNTENATKVYVGDAWAKTKHVKMKDKGIHKMNTKVKGKVTLPKKHRKKKGDESSAASGESMSGSVEEQTVGDIPPASEENSTPHVDPANLDAGDFSASMTTSSYGAAGSDEAPEEQQASQEQAGGDYSGDQDSQQIGRTEATDMDVEGDGDSMKKGFRLQSDQWTPINPARLEPDDSTQDRQGEKRDTSGGKNYGITEYQATPAPLKSTTVVLGVTRDYKPLQAFFGRQVTQAETTPAPTKISNLKYGDMYWSMVRGKVAGADEVTKEVNDIVTHVHEEPPSATEAGVKLSNGLGIDEHLSLVNGWGSHIDGTEDALARPEAFPPESKPADISSEVHLTTASPDGIALYYQNEAEEETNTEGLEIKQDQEETEENNADREHTKDESILSTTLPSVTTGSRYRGRVKYSDHLTTTSPDEDDVESRKISPSIDVDEEVVGTPTEDPAEVTENAPEDSPEDDDTEGTDKPEAIVDELRKDIESTKEDLESALENRAKNTGPNIISETGHILRGLAVAEQLDVQKW